MFARKITWIIIALLIVPSVYGSIYKAAKVYQKTRGNPARYNIIARELVREGLYYAAIPFVKDYMLDRAIKRKRSDIDSTIDTIIQEVGVKQFELLPIKILKSSASPTVQYIMAKKYFRAGKYKEALSFLGNKISSNHPIKPFALLLEGSIKSILKDYAGAIETYNECTNVANDRLEKTKNLNRKKQVEIARDYCVAGVPRTQFAAQDWSKADLSYLDIPKESYIWPELLFEEAWNSFYLKNYNRTLGKLVTYKAPVLDHVFNPEYEVLGALTYMEMCLWGDAKKAVDDFYKRYKDEAQTLKNFLKRVGRNYKYYYLLVRSREKGKVKGGELINRLLNSVVYDATYNEILDSYVKGKNEVLYLKKLKLGRFKRVVMRNVRDSLLLQRNLVGRYVRKTLMLRYAQLFRAFGGMSYIKLEVLYRKKKQIYQFSDASDRSRGSIEYLERNDKQYFWTFNGEFWADELGDYVFALANECKSEGGKE